jgi:hypothetical protein
MNSVLCIGHLPINWDDAAVSEIPSETFEYGFSHTKFQIWEPVHAGFRSLTR